MKYWGNSKLRSFSHSKYEACIYLYSLISLEEEVKNWSLASFYLSLPSAHSLPWDCILNPETAPTTLFCRLQAGAGLWKPISLSVSLIIKTLDGLEHFFFSLFPRLLPQKSLTICWSCRMLTVFNSHSDSKHRSLESWRRRRNPSPHSSILNTFKYPLERFSRPRVKVEVKKWVNHHQELTNLSQQLSIIIINVPLLVLNQSPAKSIGVEEISAHFLLSFVFAEKNQQFN